MRYAYPSVCSFVAAHDFIFPFISDLVVVFLFNLQELNSYLEFLFELIAARGPDIGLNASLSRYDFFHGHLFLARETGRLGIL